MGSKNHSLGVLREMFPGHLISSRGDVGWPARSPDLSPCDFFLGGYLKEKVFKHRPRSLEDFKERIWQEIDAIPPKTTRRVMKKFRERLQQCAANDGRRMSVKLVVFTLANNTQFYFRTTWLKLIILRWIFSKWEGLVGTGWSWLRIGKGGGHLWVRWWTFGFQKCGAFLD